MDRIDELQSGDHSFEDIAAEPMTIPAGTEIRTAVDRFQVEQQELALVLGDGAVVGLITAMDALEAVMGVVEDPLDRQIEERGRLSGGIDS